MQTKRIYMNEADASPGNGAPAASAAPPAPVAEPTAQPLDVDALVARLSKVIDEKVEAKHNAAFAKLRKDGQLKKDDPAPGTPAVQPTPSAPNVAQAGLSMADVETLIERKGVISTRSVKYGLTDAQTKRLESALAGVSREALAAEADAYLADMGLARSPESTPATPNPQPTPTPTSDKGSPAPGGVVNWERELAENPIGMSAAARALMDAKYGPEEGRRKRLEASRAQAARLQVKPH